MEMLFRTRGLLARWVPVVLVAMAGVVGCVPTSILQVTPPSSNGTSLPNTAVRTPAALPTATATIHPTAVRIPTLTETGTAVPTGISNTAAAPAAACAEQRGRVAAFGMDSRTFGRTVNYQVYLPPCYDADPTREFPVLYLLHGASADDTQWLALNVAPDADELISQGASKPFVIVMPDGDYRTGEDYAAFVKNDLIPHIETTTRVGKSRAQRAIGGISRGGYWAVELALTAPDLFSAVGGHSAVVGSYMLANLTNPDWKSLRVYLDIGQSDSLLNGVEEFATALRARGVSPDFHLNVGGHTRPYWASHTKEYLEFYTAQW